MRLMRMWIAWTQPKFGHGLARGLVVNMYSVLTYQDADVDADVQMWRRGCGCGC